MLLLRQIILQKVPKCCPIFAQNWSFGQLYNKLLHKIAKKITCFPQELTQELEINSGTNSDTKTQLKN